MARFQTTGLYIEKEIDEAQKDDKWTSPIPIPEQFADSDWAERIEMAKRARKFGQKIRKGKSATLHTIPGFRE